MLLADTFTNPSSRTPLGIGMNPNMNMNMNPNMNLNMNMNTMGMGLNASAINMGVDFTTNENFNSGGIGNGLSNGLASGAGIGGGSGGVGGNSFSQISTLSPQQILQQANEAKSNNQSDNNSTPQLNLNEFGIF